MVNCAHCGTQQGQMSSAIWGIKWGIFLVHLAEGIGGLVKNRTFPLNAGEDGEAGTCFRASSNVLVEGCHAPRLWRHRSPIRVWSKEPASPIGMASQGISNPRRRHAEQPLRCPLPDLGACRRGSAANWMVPSFQAVQEGRKRFLYQHQSENCRLHT